MARVDKEMCAGLVAGQAQLLSASGPAALSEALPDVLVHDGAFLSCPFWCSFHPDLIGGRQKGAQLIICYMSNLMLCKF